MSWRNEKIQFKDTERLLRVVPFLVQSVWWFLAQKNQRIVFFGGWVAQVLMGNLPGREDPIEVSCDLLYAERAVRPERIIVKLGPTLPREAKPAPIRSKTSTPTWRVFHALGHFIGLRLDCNGLVLIYTTVTKKLQENLFALN